MPRKPSTHVALVCAAGRAIEFRYYCPVEKRRVRRSSGTMDEKEAAEAARQLEAQLRTNTYEVRSGISWEQFRFRYDQEELRQHLRDEGRRAANEALDMFDRIQRPVLLADAVTSEALQSFRNQYAAGKFSRFGTRSPNTVRSRMATILAAFRWAEGLALCPPIPRLTRFRPKKKKKAMKGRPVTADEFQLMIAAVPGVVGEQSAPSWIFLLRGLWESGLRIEEAMFVAWDKRTAIQPRFPSPPALPSLFIPGSTQKNGDDDEIPLLPGLEQLLNEVPAAKRKGWVFNPGSLQYVIGRKPRHGRPDAEWASKVISRIGEAAGVIVEPAKGKPSAPKKSKSGKLLKPTRSKKYTPPKYASAHDLRRSLAERLEAAGIDPMVIARVMRHKSYETTRKFYAKGNLQRDAAAIREHMA